MLEIEWPVRNRWFANVKAWLIPEVDLVSPPIDVQIGSRR